MLVASDVTLLQVNVAKPIRLEKLKVAPKVRPAAGIPAKYCPLAAQLQRIESLSSSILAVKALCGKSAASAELAGHNVSLRKDSSD